MSHTVSTTLGTHGVRPGHAYSRPMASSNGRTAAVPLSELVITTAPRPVAAKAASIAWNPSSAPPCPKRSVLPVASTKKPRPTSSAWGVSMRRIVFVESTRLDWPAFDLATSMAICDRSQGVVQRPAAAISGYTCQRPSTIVPLR